MLNGALTCLVVNMDVLSYAAVLMLQCCNVMLTCALSCPVMVPSTACDHMLIGAGLVFFIKM